MEGDPIQGTVTLTGRTFDEEFLSILGSSTSSGLRIVIVEGEPSQPTAVLQGGKEFDSGTTCTQGFVVLNNDPNDPTWDKGIMIAAHCGNYPVFGGVTLTTVEERYQGTADMQVNKKMAANTVSNKFRYINNGSTVIVTVTGQRNWSQQTPGLGVCQVGNGLGQVQCGQVETQYFSPSYVSGGNSFIKATADVCGGDSGGSVFSGSTAWGIVSGGLTSDGTCPSGSTRYQYLIYGAINLQLGHANAVLNL